jgi:hypothetical protein
LHQDRQFLFRAGLKAKAQGSYRRAGKTGLFDIGVKEDFICPALFLQNSEIIKT